MSEPFVGQIQPFGFNFAPSGWARCDGQLMPIAQNTALFSLVGTTYGGDGETTFALPDLRGRAALHFGNGPGLPRFQIGQKGGTVAETLTLQQIPSHSHVLNASAMNSDATDPAGKALAVAREDTYKNDSPSTGMHGNSIANAGGSQAHNNMQPYLVINWCIALVGIFPSRP